MANYANTSLTVGNSEERTWGMIAHGIPLAALWLSAGLAGFVGSLIVYFIAKDKGELARNYAVQSLNIQLTILIWLIPSYILLLVLIGFILIPIVIIWATILHVIALVKAGSGEIWTPPLVFSFFK